MDKSKGSLRSSLLTAGIISIIVVSLVFTAASFFMFSHSMYSRYDAQLTNIMTYVEHNADIDDLQNCVNTGTTSETYAGFQKFLNSIIDDLGLSYLYVVIPKPQEGIMVNVISATNAKEIAAGETDMALFETTDAYTKKELERYYSCWDKDSITFFKENSDYGYYYTACKPLTATDGQTVALLCADISIEHLRNIQITYFVLVAIITLLIGFAFAVIISIWLRKNITKPIKELEKSARDFAERSSETEDIEVIDFKTPEDKHNKEIRSLYSAIKLMSVNLKKHVESIISAEQRARFAEEEADDMTRIAYRDSLTHVKSKAAFDKTSIETNIEIQDKGVSDLAVVMADINGLKNINDTYGHEYGDSYIKGVCRIICTTYKNSPVFRVGGDEFIVILRGDDYEKRDELLAALNEKSEACTSDMSVEPWQRYSVSAGMAVYDGSEDVTVDKLLKEADEIMYKNKAEFKERHGIGQNAKPDTE